MNQDLAGVPVRLHLPACCGPSDAMWAMEIALRFLADDPDRTHTSILLAKLYRFSDQPDAIRASGHWSHGAVVVHVYLSNQGGSP